LCKQTNDQVRPEPIGQQSLHVTGMVIGPRPGDDHVIAHTGVIWAGGRTVPAHVHNFTYGWLTPGLAYGLSYIGSLLGLICTVRARAAAGGGSRARWLILAAWAIGGTGIWVMHFMAMIGFTVPGVPIRYDIGTTVASWLTAIAVVGVGLFIVGFGRSSIFKIVVAGIITGIGVAAMHYTGMDAMRLAGTVGYDRTTVGLSVGIAIVAATTALWFTITVHRGPAIAIAAAIMAVAVCGMHYTGMAALRVLISDPGRPIEGITSSTFLVPIVLFVAFVMLTLFYALLNRTGADGGGPEGHGGRYQRVDAAASASTNRRAGLANPHVSARA
jgi:NO-binding membrane sensor protein with MHYT domain